MQCVSKFIKVFHSDRQPSESFAKLLKNRCDSLELPVYAQNILSCHHNHNQWWKSQSPEKTSTSFQNIHCIRAPVVELPTPSWYKSPNTIDSNNIGAINHEYHECSQESRTSVGNPDFKLRFDFRQCSRNVLCTATRPTVNFTNVFKTRCTLRKVACASFATFAWVQSELLDLKLKSVYYFFFHSITANWACVKMYH